MKYPYRPDWPKYKAPVYMRGHGAVVTGVRDWESTDEPSPRIEIGKLPTMPLLGGFALWAFENVDVADSYTSADTYGLLSVNFMAADTAQFGHVSSPANSGPDVGYYEGFDSGFGFGYGMGYAMASADFGSYTGTAGFSEAGNAAFGVGFPVLSYGSVAGIGDEAGIGMHTGLAHTAGMAVGSAIGE